MGFATRSSAGWRFILKTLFISALFTPSIKYALPQDATGIAELHRRFAAPPDSSRIMMRWWWFGPAAVKPEIARELEQMKAAGIGGVEIATLYPLELDDPQTGFGNTPFLSKDHLEALRFANLEAHRLGLRVDITLGSGWPFGGPEIPVTQAAGKLRVVSTDVLPRATSALAPYIDSGEQSIEAFLLPVHASPEELSMLNRSVNRSSADTRSQPKISRGSSSASSQAAPA